MGRTHEELIKASEHVHYELWMLRETRRRLNRLEMTEDNLSLRNALIESFAIHARCLIQFFGSGAPRADGKRTHRDDDIVVRDFVSAFEVDWGEFDPKADLERGHKGVAHLTYGRVEKYTNDEKVWHLDRIVAAIETQVRKFVIEAHPLSSKWDAEKGPAGPSRLHELHGTTGATGPSGPIEMQKTPPNPKAQRG